MRSLLPHSFTSVLLALLSILILQSPFTRAAGPEVLVLSSADIAVLTVSIPSTTVLQNPQSLSPSTHAVLTTARRVPLIARLDRRNRCIFHAVPPGSYLLEVWSKDYRFEPVRVDVGRESTEQAKTDKEKQKEKDAEPEPVRIEAWQTFLGNPWANKGERLGMGKGSLEISARATGPKQYYEQRQGLNVAGLLSNPMILIGIAGLAMMVGMPKLLENMDPETRAEFQEQQRKSPIAGGMSGGANPLGNFDMAAWMAGSNSKPESAGDSGATGSDAAGGKARKRG